MRDEERKQKDLAEHQMLLARRKTDEEEKLRKLEEQTRARHAREAKEAKEAIARVRELAELHAKEFEAHLVVNRIRKGDQTHVPRIGSFVGITYEARFAEGTVYEGESYSGYPFDTTLKKEGKDQLPIHQPLTFRLGEGKAIKGVEEVLRTMSLGERVQVTIDSAWAYRKGGLQDDLGNMLVPPHANLVFDLQLVRVGNDEYAKKDKSGAPRSPRLGASSPPGSPKIAPMSPTSPLSPSMWPTGGGMRSYHSPKSPKCAPSRTRLPRGAFARSNLDPPWLCPRVCVWRRSGRPSRRSRRSLSVPRRRHASHRPRWRRCPRRSRSADAHSE